MYLIFLILTLGYDERGRERERENEKERETSFGCLPYVPWLGIKPTTFWFTWQCFNRKTHPARAILKLFKYCLECRRKSAMPLKNEFFISFDFPWTFLGLLVRYFLIPHGKEASFREWCYCTNIWNSGPHPPAPNHTACAHAHTHGQHSRRHRNPVLIATASRAHAFWGHFPKSVLLVQNTEELSHSFLHKRRKQFAT